MAAAEDAQSIQHIKKKVPPKNYGQQITPELSSFFWVDQVNIFGTIGA